MNINHQRFQTLGIGLGLLFILLASESAADKAKTASYPFENRHMFFGLTLISLEQKSLVQYLDINWVSLQPHILWFDIEPHYETQPGVFDWASLDKEVKTLQDVGLDFVMVVSPIINAFSESTRNALIARLEAEMREHEISIPSTAFLHLMREHHAAQEYDVKIDTAARLERFKAFIRACVERYDHDGVHDMPGLQYEARNWHIIEEWPSEYNGLEYTILLKAIYPVIKQENSKANVILAGLAGNYSQYFAFADGYIQDPDAGRMKEFNKVFSIEEIKATSMIRLEKPEYEYVLRESKGFYDTIDIHLYEPKETYPEGELEWLKAKMLEYGYSRPVWVMEGGGPFKNGPEDPNHPMGDPYYGLWTPEEGAEFVAKLLTLSAAKGVVRQRWGLGSGEGGYWGGPWDVMGLLDKNNVPKPGYFTYKLLREKIRDFSTVKDLSYFLAPSKENYFRVRLFEFSLPSNSKVYIAWNFRTQSTPIDLSGKISAPLVLVTPIVTALDRGKPVGTKPLVELSTAVMLSKTPVFIEAFNIFAGPKRD